MRLFKKFKRSISLVLSMCLIWGCIASSVLADSTNSSAHNGIAVVQNDKNIVVVKGEDNGNEAIATLNKKTHEVTMKVIEASKSVTGISISSKNEHNYIVKVDRALNGEISATMTDVETKKQSKIGKSDKVTAQLPVILIGEWLAAALLASLYAAAAVIVVAGIEYALSTDLTQSDVNNKSYNYFYAYRDASSNNVYIGPNVSYSSARSWLSAGNDLWAKTANDSYTICKNLTGREPYYHDYEWSNNGDGYWRHYHPASIMGGKLNQHVWFF